MKKNISILIILMVFTIIFTSCSDKYSGYIDEDLNKNMDIENLKFLMTKSEVFELLGDNYDISSCVYGYEINYESLNLSIGIDFDDLVRKIIVRDKSFSLYDFKYKDSKDNAIKILTQNNFSKKNSDMYVNEYISVKLLSEDNIVTGIIIEKIM